MLGIISSVKEEGLLNINTMSLMIWYNYLLEVKVSQTEFEDTSELVPGRVEHLTPFH